MSLPVIIDAGKASMFRVMRGVVDIDDGDFCVWLGVEGSIELKFLQRLKRLGRLPNTVMQNNSLD